jgi:hypothetical protein
MVDRAFKEDWIDFYPRAGKVGGAFCSNLPFFGQSRILTNFSGSFGSVVTLAHELGHAYHGQQIESHRPLNIGYTMPVAETASNFNELIIVNDAISKAKGGEKIALIESQIQDCAQIIVDIYSRFLFEDEVIRRRKNKFMFADELEAIMLDAQKQAYGDGLDPDYLHPYMWCCKSHYYSAGLSYYNFPYAFGGLFSRGLYAKYLEEGEAFLPKYRALLKATTVESVENVAKIAGIDLTKPEFWRTSLQVIADRIDEFIAKNRGKRVTYEENAKLYIYSGIVDRYTAQQHMNSFKEEIHVIRFDDIAIATNPFELFLDYGNQIRARSKAKQTFLIQLACGAEGYLPTKKAEEGSHYSAYVSSGFTGSVGGEILVRETLERINNKF